MMTSLHDVMYAYLFSTAAFAAEHAETDYVCTRNDDVITHRVEVLLHLRQRYVIVGSLGARQGRFYVSQIDLESICEDRIYTGVVISKESLGLQVTVKSVSLTCGRSRWCGSL